MFDMSLLPIDRLKLINRHLYPDNRGYFGEIYRESDFGSEVPCFVQDNQSFSERNVLRGMHLQASQWQLLTVLKGSIRDLTVDLGSSSPTFGMINLLEMKHDSNNQLLIPPGVAHGFCVLSESAILHYKSSVYYGETPQYGVAWNSTELKEFWPGNEWIISERDSGFPTIGDFLESGITI
jgi:dTDP-4-dehydrorhamnose 3,5-epimerase